MFLSGPFSGPVSYAELNEHGQQIGYDAQKGPPKIKNIDLAYLMGADPTIASNTTSNYFISSMQVGKGSADKLSDEVEYRTLPISLN